MKRLLFMLMLMPAIALPQGIDSSLYNWVNQGHFYHGGQSFQRWPGHWWDTLATLRDVRNGGWGGGAVLDTIHTFSIYHDPGPSHINYIREGTVSSYHQWQYWTPPQFHDHNILHSNEKFIKWPWGDNIAAAGSIVAPSYVFTSIAQDAIDWAITGTVAFSIRWPIVPRGGGFWECLSDHCDLSLQFYIWDNEHAIKRWMTVGYGSWENHTSWYSTHDTSNSVVFNMNNLYWNALKNGYPGYTLTFWVMGIDPGEMFAWRIVASNTPNYLMDSRPTDAYPVWQYDKGYALDIETATTYNLPGYWTPLAWIDSSATAWDWYFENGINVKKDIHTYQNVNALQGLSSGCINGLDTVSGSLTLTNLMGVPGSLVNRMPDSTRGGWVLPTHLDTIAGQLDLPATPIGGRFKVVIPDSNISFIYSHDTVWVRGTTGAGASAASFYTSPADKNPNTASSFNDEFDGANGSMPDTVTGTKWKWMGTYGHPNNTLQERSGALIWSDTSNVAGDFVKLLGQKLGATDTAFTITIKYKANGKAIPYGFAGLFALDSTNGRIYFLRERFDNTGGIALDAAKSTGPQGTMSYAFSNSFREQREVADFCYIRIEKTTARVFNFYSSRDGLTWNLEFTGDNSWIESSGTVNWVGIFIGCNQNAGQTTITSSFFWFRANWTADYDPTLGH
jgi:hypothetical protein